MDAGARKSPVCTHAKAPDFGQHAVTAGIVYERSGCLAQASTSVAFVAAALRGAKDQPHGDQDPRLSLDLRLQGDAEPEILADRDIAGRCSKGWQISF
jgi:hypothetical protein